MDGKEGTTEETPTYAWLTHKYATVKSQVESGIEEIRLIQKCIKHSIKRPQTDKNEENIENLKNICGKDECKQFSDAALKMTSFATTINTLEETLAIDVDKYVVKTMKEFSVENSKRVKQIDESYQSLQKQLKNKESSLNKAKKNCLKLLDSLKQWIEKGDANPKDVTKREKTQKECNKKFAKYEADYTEFRDLRKIFYEEELPNKLKELESIERLRLNTVETHFQTFVELIKTFSTKMQECKDKSSQACNVLDKDKDFSDCVTNWIHDFGQAQEIPDVPFGLPCSAKNILEHKFNTIPEGTVRSELSNRQRESGDKRSKLKKKKSGKKVWRSNTVSKLVKNKKTSTKKKGKSGNHQNIVKHLPQSPKGGLEIEITSDTSIKDFFASIEKKFGFNLHDLVPVFTDELISTVGDLMDDPDWVNQVQMDQKYVEVIQHSLNKLQGSKKSTSTVPIKSATKAPTPSASPEMAPPPIPDEKSPEVNKTSRGSIDAAAMSAPPPPPPESDEDDENEDDKPATVSKDSDANQVKSWLVANGFDTTPFEDKDGEQFFSASKKDLKKIYGVATGVRLYNRRQSCT